ncbi:hypothetical protein RISK_000208 [Rhodopirellula islandica]|uniref:Uncharacterized protein n=1 Tax=Rhodopirellula islandica TaxID=595434 RepID=A0A0J1BME5_RHOIS|nr:hypothetical protein RISK_000208 [Rhodopirellula islandica]
MIDACEEGSPHTPLNDMHDPNFACIKLFTSLRPRHGKALPLGTD